jgi:hypothetical protein
VCYQIEISSDEETAIHETRANSPDRGIARLVRRISHPSTTFPSESKGHAEQEIRGDATYVIYAWFLPDAAMEAGWKVRGDVCVVQHRSTPHSYGVVHETFIDLIQQATENQRSDR